MKFVTFIAIIDLPEGTRTPVKINPAHVVGIASPMGANGPLLDRCEVLVSGGMFHVVGTVDEVSAALESATAPPVAAAVEVAPTDLEMAARVLVMLAQAASTDVGWDSLSITAIDKVVGVADDDMDWDSTADALRVLAAKLRGGG